MRNLEALAIANLEYHGVIDVDNPAEYYVVNRKPDFVAYNDDEDIVLFNDIDAILLARR